MKKASSFDWKAAFLGGFVSAAGALAFYVAYLEVQQRVPVFPPPPNTNLPKK